MELDATKTLETAMRGLENLAGKERYEKDSPTLAGLNVACTYLKGQVDLLKSQWAKNELDRAIEAPQEAPEASDDGIIETEQTKTGTFQPVAPEPAGKARREK